MNLYLVSAGIINQSIKILLRLYILHKSDFFSLIYFLDNYKWLHDNELYV